MCREEILVDNRSMKLLIVDDHPVVREGLAALLRQLAPEMTVVLAEGGSQGLDLANGHPDLDLVVLDLAMPGSDGFATLHEFGRLQPQLPVVVLSGTIQRGEYLPVLEADGFWSKPVELHRLERVHKHCPAHRNTWRNKSSVFDGEVLLHRLPSGTYGLGATSGSHSVVAVLASGP